MVTDPNVRYSHNTYPAGMYLHYSTARPNTSGIDIYYNTKYQIPHLYARKQTELTSSSNPSDSWLKGEDDVSFP